MFGDGEGNVALVVGGFGSEGVEKLLIMSGIDLDINLDIAYGSLRKNDFWTKDVYTSHDVEHEEAENNFGNGDCFAREPHSCMKRRKRNYPRPKLT